MDDTARELQEIDRQIKILDARDHFLPFVELTMPDNTKSADDLLATRYQAAMHHKAMCR